MRTDMPLPLPTSAVQDWPKGPYLWIDERTLCISIPFTWNLPEVRQELMYSPKRNPFWDKVIVGGPAVELMPYFFDSLPSVSIGHDMPGILQRINPMATRTTTGCINKCGFCAIGRGKVEGGGFKELNDWPDLPIICDNNLLASSIEHFDRVIDRLVKWQWADFNQGLDARLLTKHHAEQLARIKKPMIRLALDNNGYKNAWSVAWDNLRGAGIAKNKIRSYALIGFNSDPAEAWARCEWIESHGIKVLPMWFHSLDQLEANTVTDHQENLGWNDFERRRIMRWYYQHQRVTK